MNDRTRRADSGKPRSTVNSAGSGSIPECPLPTTAATVATPTIVIDCNEQIPFCFPWPHTVQHLQTGDYSVVGLETRLTVERKSRPDFIKTLLDRDKWTVFQDELDRMQAMNRANGQALIIVTAGWPECLDHCRNAVDRQRLRRRVVKITGQWGVPIMFGGEYAEANVLAGAILYHAWKRGERR